MKGGASAAIARRGMWIQEKVPLLIKVIDPSIHWNQPRRQQWSDALFGSGENGQLESDKKGRFGSGRKGHCAVG